MVWQQFIKCHLLYQEGQANKPVLSCQPQHTRLLPRAPEAWNPPGLFLIHLAFKQNQVFLEKVIRVPVHPCVGPSWWGTRVQPGQQFPCPVAPGAAPARCCWFWRMRAQLRAAEQPRAGCPLLATFTTAAKNSAQNSGWRWRDVTASETERGSPRISELREMFV